MQSRFSYFQGTHSEHEVLFRPISQFKVIYACKNIIDSKETSSLQRSGFPDIIGIEQIDDESPKPEPPHQPAATRTLELKGEGGFMTALRALQDATLDEDTIRVLKLDFSLVWFRAADCSTLAQKVGALQQLQSLELLLVGNAIGDAACSALAQKVGDLEQLQSLVLNLNCNEIGDAGKQALKNLEAVRSSRGSTKIHV